MSDYSAEDISHLEGLDAVRKRPGMYIGSTDSRGLIHLVWEIVDNSVDEALAGYATRIDVTMHDDGLIEVEDNGRGIPVDTHKKSGKSALELVLTELHAGGKFGGKAFAVSGGLHGVGASVTNALSSRLDATVKRDGKFYEMSFQRGIPGTFNGEGEDATFTKKSGPRSHGRVPKGETGTTIKFYPDRAVFMSDAVIDPKLVADRLQQTAFLVPGLVCALHHNGETTEFCYQGGISDMVEYFAVGSPLTKQPIMISGSGEFTENIPVLDDEGHMTMTETLRNVDVDVSIYPTNGYDSDVKGFVNVVSTPMGTHVKGFEAGLVNWVRNSATLKAKDEPPKTEDCLEGIYAVVSIKVPEPHFEGQTKSTLGTRPVQNIVRDVVEAGLEAWAKSRGSGSAAKTLLEKAVTAARTRIAAREHRDTQRRKTALEGGSNLPAKLVDCRERVGSELIIVEGDSALGTARAGRYASHQALLPLRGKILNAQKASPKQILDNAECAAIIQTIGAGSGATFDLQQSRYSRVILLSDADPDGAGHINPLLITLFWNQLRPIIESGSLYVAMPPLYVITTGGRSSRTIFCVTVEEMEREVAALERAKEPIKQLMRMKGLGEMSSHELRATTMDPSTRFLRRVTVEDAKAAGDMVELLMGSEVGPRKEYIMANKTEVDL